MDPLYKSIGLGQIDHFSVLVRTGMLNGATSFFTDQLGWPEIRSARVHAMWGEARFVHDPSLIPVIRVQLTELLGDNEVKIFPGVHLAIGFREPKDAAKKVLEWAQYAGTPAEMEEVPGGKYFVRLPGLFRTEFEFVPLF